MHIDLFVTLRNPDHVILSLQVCNVVKVSDVMTPVRIPDVAACALLESCPYHLATNDRNDSEYEEEGGSSLEGGSSSSASDHKSDGSTQPSKKKRKVLFDVEYSLPNHCSTPNANKSYRTHPDFKKTILYLMML